MVGLDVSGLIGNRGLVGPGNPVNGSGFAKYYPAGWWPCAYGNNKGPDIVGFVGPLTKLYIAEDFSDAYELVTIGGQYINNNAAPAWNMDTENPIYVGWMEHGDQGTINGAMRSTATLPVAVGLVEVPLLRFVM